MVKNLLMVHDDEECHLKLQTGIVNSLLLLNNKLMLLLQRR